jgi:hypothetical protein
MRNQKLFHKTIILLKELGYTYHEALAIASQQQNNNSRYYRLLQNGKRQSETRTKQ